MAESPKKEPMEMKVEPTDVPAPVTVVEPTDELEEIQCEEEPCGLKSFFYTSKTWPGTNSGTSQEEAKEIANTCDSKGRAC